MYNPLFLFTIYVSFLFNIIWSDVFNCLYCYYLYEIYYRKGIYDNIKFIIIVICYIYLGSVQRRIGVSRNLSHSQLSKYRTNMIFLGKLYVKKTSLD